MDPEKKTFAIYTIYDNPSDWPGEFALKKWLISFKETLQDLNFIYNSKNLEACRDQMRQKGLSNLDREENDDPVIVVSWI